MKATIIIGKCEIKLRDLAEASVDAIVTDPPYELGFMGKAWDSSGVAYSAPMWRECLRALKPGGYLLSFGGSRTYHRMASAIEDAGFEIRDQIMWIYGSGFPKSLDVSKAIDKAAEAVREVIGTKRNLKGDSGPQTYACLGEFNQSKFSDVTAPATDAAKQWDGWGTALKPAHEPIVVARKPLIGTVVANVLKYGTGAMDIDGCRVEPTGERLGGGGEKRATFEKTEGWSRPWMSDPEHSAAHAAKVRQNVDNASALGRWPANVIHDGSDEVVSLFPSGTSGTGCVKKASGADAKGNSGSSYGAESRPAGSEMITYGDTGSAARFFYTAKADKEERESGLYDLAPKNKRANTHPTVKPVDLMCYLVRLVTPEGGVVLDPFTGSGSTGIAALKEGCDFIGIEENADYAGLAERRIKQALPLFADVVLK